MAYWLAVTIPENWEKCVQLNLWGTTDRYASLMTNRLRLENPFQAGRVSELPAVLGTKGMRGRVLSSTSRENGAFYTPAHVAKRMARLLSLESPATVLDPACGEGDLLTAVADEFGTRGIRFIGIDRNPKALEACRNTLGTRGANILVRRLDFFAGDLSEVVNETANVYVTMNPPFKGYGHLSSRRRKEILKTTPGLQGRYNLAHAFLVRVLTELHPKSVVALLPGTWSWGSYNHLRYLIDLPQNSWRELPESTFDGATTTAGLLVLQNLDGQAPAGPFETSARVRSTRNLRQGVATGADATFIRIAGLRPRSGRIVRVARGRDVAMNRSVSELPRLWVPPKHETDALASFIKALPEPDLKRLAGRFCVRRMQRPIWSFHESFPRWFLGKPKLIVPEVCTKISTVYDAQGRVLPLHSTIAIRATDSAEARRMASVLESQWAWDWLRPRCPRMVNGAIRLTTPVLRDLLDQHR